MDEGLRFCCCREDVVPVVCFEDEGFRFCCCGDDVRSVDLLEGDILPTDLLNLLDAYLHIILHLH